ncbi:MAG: ATP-dependent Clp protease adaptor ClpS [Phycisphaerae bacterium]|nr:ATP-dependent Clp protease adaptor ClpS [Phycisphaerae bacterium]
MPENSRGEQAAEPPAEPGGEDAAGAVATEQQPTRMAPRLLPPYKVLLHNDDVNEFTYVISAIVKLTPLSREEAIHRTLEAHETGITLLMVTHKERAELIQEQFAACSLTVTIEPDEAG